MDGSSIFFDAGIEIEDLLEFAGIMDLLNRLGNPQHRTPQRGTAEPIQLDRPLRNDQYLLKLAGNLASLSVKINCNAVFNPAWVAAETAALGIGGGVGWLSLAMVLSNLVLLPPGIVLLVTLAAALHEGPNRKAWVHRHPRMLLSTATGLLVLSLILVGLRVVSASHPLPPLIDRAMVYKK